MEGMMKRILLTATCILGASLIQPGCASAQSWLQELKLPPGFSIDVFAQARGARALVLARQLGHVFVSTRRDTIYAIPLRDDDGHHPTYPVLTGLKAPNGIAWKDGYLYVGEQHRLTRYRVPSIDALPGLEPEVLFDGLPKKSWHGYRYITFGADGALYMGVGAACNVCSLHGLEGTILKFTPGQWDQPEIAATGVRNTVGLDVHPENGQIYFTDNGADGMGDDSPPDELNAMGPLGAHYGFPWFGGGEDRTPHFKLLPAPEGNIKPIVEFQAHVAPLGVDFYEGRMFPDDYRFDAFVAQHGSWNRSTPVGYRVMRVRFGSGGKIIGKEPFIEGWLRPNEDVLGRPVDVEELPDGSLLISDDGAGLIYRVTYRKP